MKDFKPAVLLFVTLTVVCGGIYPAAVTLVAGIAFPRQAAGSLVNDSSGRVIGSTLIGQPFSDPKYFWPRPSATSPFAYNPGASSGTNTGPTNPAFLAAVADRVTALRASGITGPVPADLVLASASGLDPHVTPAGARAQVARIAQARGLNAAGLERLVASRVEERQFGLLGEPRVNVLELNLALDQLKRPMGAITREQISSLPPEK
jgi:potassium-transporting ATPase KdpC subunit